MKMGKLVFVDKEEAVRRMDRWGGEGTPFFFMIDFDMEQCLVERPEDIPEDELLFLFPRAGNWAGKMPRLKEPFLWKSFPESFEDYSHSFDIVRRNIWEGNTFLINLTCATPVESDLSLFRIFVRAEALYKLWLKDRFVVFSPEIFVRIQDGFISSHPMKGTIDASVPDAGLRLLSDEKETAEHATITDLIRNDLSQIADEVTVMRYRYLDEVDTHDGRLLQMSSEIRGRLPLDYARRLGELFFRLLPAGSVTGAPKKKTVDIIREAENYSRGFYTGVMGYFDGKDLDSAVMIRFLEQEAGGKLVFKSGGGITFLSDVRDEYEEMKRKVYVPIY